jgi:hypothetical protein
MPSSSVLCLVSCCCCCFGTFLLLRTLLRVIFLAAATTSRLFALLFRKPWCVSYARFSDTEIDWIAYMQEVKGVIDGSYNYYDLKVCFSFLSCMPQIMVLPMLRCLYSSVLCCLCEWSLVGCAEGFVRLL